MITKQKVETTYKESNYGSGVRTQSCQVVLRQLTENLIERGASVDAVAIFQNDFCNLNGITVPDSFFPESATIEDFFDEKLIPSDKNVSAKDVFGCYEKWCKLNGIVPRTKGNFFFELKCRGLFHKTGTVDGRTLKTVVKGYRIAE